MNVILLMYMVKTKTNLNKYFPYNIFMQITLFIKSIVIIFDILSFWFVILFIKIKKSLILTQFKDYIMLIIIFKICKNFNNILAVHRS